MGVNGNPPVRNMAIPSSPPPPAARFLVREEKPKNPKNGDDGGFVTGVIVGGLLF